MSKYLNIFYHTLFISILLFPFQTKALNNIAGGELTYTCLGSNQYNVKLTIYKTCFLGLPATESIDVYNTSGTKITTVDISLINTTRRIGSSPDPCTADITSLCIDVGEYEGIINLPPIAGGYQLIHEVDNDGKQKAINGPDFESSAFAITVPDVTVVSCNNSATFDVWPTVYVCQDIQLNYDVSATDIDGDVLVYSLCNPLEKGQPNTPYPFTAGYTATSPLGAASPISIDANTGIISGKPTELGNYVVGVCVTEYRNGVLISKSSRDFRFDVFKCEKLVASSSTNALTNCTTSEVSFFNSSVGAISYEWDFGDLSPTSNTFEPKHTYTAYGTYTARLVVFDVTMGCTDTSYTTVDVQACRPCGMEVNVQTIPGSCATSKECARVKYEYPYTCSCLCLVGGMQYGTTPSGFICGASSSNGSGSIPDISDVHVTVDGTFLPESTTIVTETKGTAYCGAWVEYKFSGGNIIVEFNAMVGNPPPGGAIATITGGTPPYTIQWVTNPIQFGDTAKGLEPGNYDVIVTDVNGCIEVVNFTINGDNPISVTATAKNVTSCLVDDGELHANVTGNNGTIYYQWNPGGYTTADVTNVPPGTYTVTVIDNDSCEISATVTVGGVPDIAMTTNITDVVCADANNGAVTVTNTTGGSPNYTYSWNTNPIQTGGTATGLGKGFYTVTATDLNGCTGQKSLTLQGPLPLDLVVSGTDASCANINDGTVSVAVTDGTPGYTYSWNTTPEQTGGTATGLQGGKMYVVTVKDSKGCIAKDSITINQPTKLEIDVLNKSTISCTNLFDGAAEAQVLGGDGNYNYAWSCSAENTANVTGLTVGICNVTVTDGNGCSIVGSVEIVNLIPLSVTINSTNSCGTATDGTATAVPVGGLSPYSYVWDCTTNTTQTISNLASGSNCTVTITDAGGCTATASTSITSNPAVILSTVVTPDCDNTSVGEINLTVSTGTGPYIYNWSNSATTEDITGLPGNTNYKITVFDDNNCFDTLTVNVGMEACRPSVTVSTTNDTICAGDTTTLTALASGGTPSFTYLWDNGITAITAGPHQVNPTMNTTYTVIATDNVGDKDTATITISVNPLLPVTLTTYSNECLEASSIALTGGTPVGGSYSGTGVSGINLFDPTIAGVGTHIITYTFSDGNGCTNSDTTTIKVNALPLTTLGAFADVCIDSSIFTLTGGMPLGGTYTGTGVSGNNFDPSVAGAGTHTINYNFIDGNGCSDTVTSTITVNPLPPVILTPYDDVCFDSPAFTLEGGAPLGGTYTISGVVSTDFDPAILGIGTHPIVYFYTDPNGCGLYKDTVNITVNPIPTVNPGLDDTLCAGESFTLTGQGTATSYSWNNGVTDNIPFIISKTTIYTLTGTANGCSSIDSVTITALPQANINFNIKPATCISEEDGEIIAAITKGTPPYILLWNSGDTTNKLVELPIGNYTLTVTDINGCKINSTALLFSDNSDCEYVLWVANVFSPNGDGNNDVLHVMGENIETINFTIYNRWGNKIFESSNQTAGWDGTFNGKKVNTGVYAFYVEATFIGGIEKQLKGNVLLQK